MQAKECNKYLAVWTKWLKSSGKEPLTPEISEAVDHIVACPSCLAEVPEIIVKIADRPDTLKPRERLSAFLKMQQEKGLTQTAIKYPDIAESIIQEPDLLRKMLVLQKSISGDNLKTKIPPDIAYAVDNELHPVDWIYLFAKQFGLSEKGEMVSQPRLTVEFNIDEGQVSINFNAVPGLASLSEKQVLVDKNLGNEQNTRNVVVRADIYVAQVSIDPTKPQVRVLLPFLPEYQNTPPEVSLISDSGIIESRNCVKKEEGFETTFVNIKDGNYLVAIDIIKNKQGLQQRKPFIQKLPRRLIKGNDLENMQSGDSPQKE